MLTFDAAAHRYYWDGQPVPGVTTILQPLTDFGAVSEEVLRAASEFGTAVHLACELSDKKTLDFKQLDEHLVPYLEAWHKFSGDYEVQWNGIEERVFHPKLRYAGTLDRRGIVRGRRAYVDIKSSVQLYPSVGPQLAAYARADDEVMGGAALRMAVQLRPDGTYHAKTYTDPSDWPVFASLLTLRSWCARHEITPKF